MKKLDGKELNGKELELFKQRIKMLKSDNYSGYAAVYKQMPGTIINNSVTGSGRGLLHIACEFSSSHLVRRVLDHTYNPNKKDGMEMTALMLAAKRGDLNSIKILLKDERVIAGLKDGQGRTAADYSSSAEVTEILYNHIERQQRFLSKCLFETNVNGCFISYDDLVEGGADVNYSNNYERRPLHEVAYHGVYDACKLFLRHGAEIDCKDCSGRTPLMLAAGEGNAEVVELLLDAGADLNAEDKHRDSPADYFEAFVEGMVANFKRGKSILDSFKRRGKFFNSRRHPSVSELNELLNEKE